MRKLYMPELQKLMQDAFKDLKGREYFPSIRLDTAMFLIKRHNKLERALQRCAQARNSAEQKKACLEAQSLLKELNEYDKNKE